MLTSGKYHHHHKVCLFIVYYIAISCHFGCVIMLIKSVFISTYCQQLFTVINNTPQTVSLTIFYCLYFHASIVKI